MTLAEMLADCYRRLNHPTTPASAVTTRLTAMLNEGQQALISVPGFTGWIAQHQPPLTFTSAANTYFYALPQGLARVETIRELTNRRTLAMGTREWWHAIEPDPSSMTGIPQYWIPYGWMPVFKQPADASQIFAKSTSASDTQSVYIEAIRSGGGEPITLNTTLTGTTAVSLSASVTDLVEITKFYVSTAAAGAISLYEDSGVGTQLGTITQGQTSARYQAIALYPTPSTTITYYVDGERNLPDLVNTTDTPIFPARFHRGLIYYALKEEFTKTDDTRAQKYELLWKQTISELKYFLTAPSDYLPVSGSVNNTGRSRLGAWYPAD